MPTTPSFVKNNNTVLHNISNESNEQDGIVGGLIFRRMVPSWWKRSRFLFHNRRHGTDERCDDHNQQQHQQQYQQQQQQQQQGAVAANENHEINAVEIVTVKNMTNTHRHNNDSNTFQDQNNITLVDDEDDDDDVTSTGTYYNNNNNNNNSRERFHLLAQIQGLEMALAARDDHYQALIAQIQDEIVEEQAALQQLVANLTATLQQIQQDASIQQNQHVVTIQQYQAMIQQLQERLRQQQVALMRQDIVTADARQARAYLGQQVAYHKEQAIRLVKNLPRIYQQELDDMTTQRDFWYRRYQQERTNRISDRDTIRAELDTELRVALADRQLAQSAADREQRRMQQLWQRRYDGMERQLHRVQQDLHDAYMIIEARDQVIAQYEVQRNSFRQWARQGMRIVRQRIMKGEHRL